MLFKLEKPDLSKIDHKQIFELLIGNNKTEIFDFIKRTSSKYLYWDKIRYEKPSPKEISKKELWMIIKIFRESQAIKTGEPVFVTDESKGLVY